MLQAFGHFIFINWKQTFHSYFQNCTTVRMEVIVNGYLIELRKKFYFAIYVFVMVMVQDHFPKDFLSEGMFMSKSLIMKKQ
jgi:hypothetical protein